MQTEQQPKIASLVFLQTVSAAVTQLKQKLQQDYERVYPGLGEIIHLILDEEEAKAWELSLFPHLFLPDLVEAHVAKLGLATRGDKTRRGPGSASFPRYAKLPTSSRLCGLLSQRGSPCTRSSKIRQ